MKQLTVVILFLTLVAVLSAAVMSSFVHGAERIDVTEVTSKENVGKVVDVPVGGGGAVWVVETEKGTYIPVEMYRSDVYKFKANETLYRYVHIHACYLGNEEGVVFQITCNNFY